MSFRAAFLDMAAPAIKSFRAAFLIMPVAVIFNVSLWKAMLVLFGYLSFESLDQWLTQRLAQEAKEKVIEDETSGWETDSHDPASETKGNFTRVKLIGHEQIIVTRVAEILRRIP